LKENLWKIYMDKLQVQGGVNEGVYNSFFLLTIKYSHILGYKVLLTSKLSSILEYELK
jgi:hypothetical protein